MRRHAPPDGSTADQRARISRQVLVEAEIRVAKLLVEMARDRTFASLGFRDLGHYGTGLGFSERRTHELSDAGRAFLIAADLEEEVRWGVLPIESAASLGRVLGDPRFAAEVDHLRTVARERPPTGLERAVREATRRLNSTSGTAGSPPGR